MLIPEVRIGRLVRLRRREWSPREGGGCRREGAEPPQRLSPTRAVRQVIGAAAPGKAPGHGLACGDRGVGLTPGGKVKGSEDRRGGRARNQPADPARAWLPRAGGKGLTGFPGNGPGSGARPGSEVSLERQASHGAARRPGQWRGRFRVTWRAGAPRERPRSTWEGGCFFSREVVFPLARASGRRGDGVAVRAAGREGGGLGAGAGGALPRLAQRR